MVSERLLIRGGIVLPLEGRKVVHDPGSVLIEGKEIRAVGPVDELDALAPDATVVVYNTGSGASYRE